MIRIGENAPDFELHAQNGELVRLDQFRGKKVVLYFYPKDDTPGCTKEACSFNDHLGVMKKKGAVVLGLSADKVDSHARFSAKYGLRFPLLSDPEKKVIRAYGVWKQKKLYGRTYMGIERTTFVIDERGKVAAIFPKVKVDGHSDDILEAL
jgi:thioredoxin-dependent peroxiredoxin